MSRTEQLLKKDYNDLTQADKDYLITMANQNLRRLERKGFQEESASYRNIEKYANQEGKSKKYYNKGIYTDKDGTEIDTIRFTKDFKNWKKGEQREYIEQVQKFLENKTATVAGTKEAMRKTYDKYMDKYDFYKKAKESTEAAIKQAEKEKGRPLTEKQKAAIEKKVTKKNYERGFKQHRELWRIYRNNVSNDKKNSKAESGQIMQIMINNKEFYALDQEEREEAMKYMATNSVKEGLEYIKHFKDDFD